MKMSETRKELVDKFEYLISSYQTDNIELNDWEVDFLDSIQSQLYASDGYLTDLQIEKLEQIYDKYNH